MRYAVVDTNVLIVAEGASHADDECRATAKAALWDTRSRRTLVVDRQWKILAVYRAHFEGHDQTGEGAEFYIWAVARSGVRKVDLTHHPYRVFVEFPSDQRLERFDRSDRKFVAATVASGVENTELLNAVDSDYSEQRDALRDTGVLVRELCAQHLRTGRRRRRR